MREETNTSPETLLRELRSAEHRIYSQNGEDGVLACIFQAIGTSNRFFVEFGAWDGQHWSNTAHLRLAEGWTGLLMDGSPERVNGPVRQETVTAENVNALFVRYGVPERFDLLSIDIDGNEYWVWRALRDHRPRVVVIEYNIFFGTDVSKTIAYDPTHAWEKDSYYHGASLAALRKLGREKGYSLLHTDSYGPNAFFVASDELPPSLVDLPIEQVAAWDWGLGAEPPNPARQAWLDV